MHFNEPNMKKSTNLDGCCVVLAALICSVFFSPDQSLASKVQIVNKSLAEASHFEFSGPSDWHYDVTRQTKAGGLVVSVQFKNVKPDEIQSLENFRDRRINKIVVKEGVNQDATADFYLANKMKFFDYLTDSPTALVFDVYQDSGPKKEKTFTKPLAKVASSKKQKRGIASLEKPEIGYQPPLLKKASEQESSFNVLDLADQDNKRFQFNESDIDPNALILAEKEIYLNLPEYNEPVTPSLAVLENEKTNFEVSADKSEENQIVRLIIRLFNEEKYAVALKTYKFLEEKYPKSNYAELLHLMKAEIYYKLWKRDEKLPDLETSMALYKEHLLRFPETPYKNKITYLLGMIYLNRGNYIDALNHFQTAVKDNPDSAYYWPMKMAVAECYRELKQQDAALRELSDIESNAKSVDFTEQARFRRGDVYFKMGLYDDAMAEYSAAIKKYPHNTKDSANAYYNTAEALFRQKKYKKALDQYLVFLKKFPDNDYSSYAMNRVGNALEIIGAPWKQVQGAYIEDYYRYRNTPAAFLSQLKINLDRFDKMKPKEVEDVVKETQASIPEGKIENIESLVKISLADGFLKRKEYTKAFETYSWFYKEDLRSPYLSLVQDRIYKTLTLELQNLSESKKDMTVIERYLKNKNSWLRNNSRIDTDYFVGKAYEHLDLFDKAEGYYEGVYQKLSKLTPDQEKRRELFETPLSIDSLRLRMARVALNLDEVKKSTELTSKIKAPEKLSPEEKIELSLVAADNAEKESRFDEAIAQLKILSESWPKNSKPNLLLEPWYRISKLYSLEKKNDEAIKWVDKYMALISSSKNPQEDFDMTLLRNACEYAAELYDHSKMADKAINIYKNLIEKYSDSQTPTQSLKYKLGKIYFDQNNINEAERVWADLKQSDKKGLWAKMADENLANLKWSNKFKRYVIRRSTASGDEK